MGGGGGGNYNPYPGGVGVVYVMSRGGAINLDLGWGAAINLVLGRRWG